MVLSGTARFLSVALLSSLPTATALTLLPLRAVASQFPEGVIAQSVQVQDPTLQPGDSSNEDLRPLAQDGSILSIRGGQRLMSEASSAVAAQNYDLAVRRLQEARQVFNQLSNFYQELAASFSGIDPRIADSQRQQALNTAQMRDQATYQLALVHRAQNKPELAVPLLVQIIRSQQPTRELGQQAYRQLFELGFVDSPYPRQNGNSTSNVPSQ